MTAADKGHWRLLLVLVVPFNRSVTPFCCDNLVSSFTNIPIIHKKSTKTSKKITRQLNLITLKLVSYHFHKLDWTSFLYSDIFHPVLDCTEFSTLTNSINICNAGPAPVSSQIPTSTYGSWTIKPLRPASIYATRRHTALQKNFAV